MPCVKTIDSSPLPLTSCFFHLCSGVPCTRQLNERRSRLVGNHPASTYFFYLGSPSSFLRFSLLLFSLFFISFCPRQRVTGSTVSGETRCHWKMRKCFGQTRTKYRIIGRTVSRVLSNACKVRSINRFRGYELVSVGFVLERSLGNLYRGI